VTQYQEWQEWCSVALLRSPAAQCFGLVLEHGLCGVGRGLSERTVDCGSRPSLAECTMTVPVCCYSIDAPGEPKTSEYTTIKSHRAWIVGHVVFGSGGAVDFSSQCGGVLI